MLKLTNRTGIKINSPTLRSYLGNKTNPVSGPAVLILDQFTDTDGTLLTAHTIAPINTPAATWVSPGVSFGGSPVITSNSIITTTYVSAVVNSGVFGVTVSQSARNNVGASDVYIVFRQSNTANYFLMQLSAASMRIYSYIASTLVLRATVAQTWSVGVTKTMTLTDDGTLITASLSTGESCSYSSASLGTNTRQGFSSGNSTIDNFQVTTL